MHNLLFGGVCIYEKAKHVRTHAQYTNRKYSDLTFELGEEVMQNISM